VKSKALSPDAAIILEWVKTGASVLDLGCGDGELLSLLTDHKQVKSQGIEIDEQAVYRCVARGISVFHQDIDNGLSEYGDRAFDYVILNQTFQQVRKPDRVLSESLRVGRKVIVGFPNFAHYRSRMQMVMYGKAPVTSSLPYEWHDTPNLHFLSIRDFLDYCRKRSILIEQSSSLTEDRVVRFLPNLLGRTGLFLISKP
jgi:methionine biosynthesis protein MetW